MAENYNTKITGTQASESFTEEQLKNTWLQFAAAIKNDKPRMFQLLKNHLPKLLPEYKIVLNVASAGQKKDFHERLENDLIKYLKENLNNYRLVLSVTVDKAKTKPNVVYTATDKFKYLSDQNNLLNKLKQQFNLDLE